VYPPEPWHLRGHLFLSVFLVPRSELPALPQPLAAVVRPVTIAGRAVVGGAWVRYEAGGVLQYRELLTAVLVREGRRPRVSIQHIWVDSEASRAGGRELWGIPKQLAPLDVGDRASRAPFASTTRTRGVRLPGRWPTPMTLVQVRHGSVKRTAVAGRARVRIGRSGWWVDERGPLRYLTGHRPLLSATLADFRLRFGG
jgi:hypothetical protein